MRSILTLCTLLLLGSAGLSLSTDAQAADMPWFSQRGAERMVQSSVPDYYAYLQTLRQKNPEKYLERLHQAMMLIHSSSADPAIFDAWRAEWDVERRYMARVEDWKAATTPAEKARIRAELVALSTAWEQARLALFTAKIPVFEDRLYNLEINLQDVQMNIDSYAEERVMHSLNE